MKAWLFNPDNDIALASDLPSATLPPAAIVMRRAGAFLPFFLADDDHTVISDGVNAAWFDGFRRRFGLKADIWPHRTDIYTPSPWGWSRAARHTFASIGFPDDTLPSDDKLGIIRRLSHRRTASRMASWISENFDLPLWPPAIEAESPDALRAILASPVYASGAVIKAPWSSSGRGVRFVRPEAFDSAIAQSAGTIRRQGSVMVEPLMDAHSDFALLFHCADRGVSFVGPSLFRADSAGHYRGNVVADDRALFDEIHRIVPSQLVASLIEALLAAIGRFVALKYNGPVGIDLCASPQGLIHICEANIRYTMGFVARGIARRIPYRALLASAPHNKIPERAILLTPPGTDTCFYLSSDR